MHELDLFLGIVLVAVEVGGPQADEEAFKMLHPLRELEEDPPFEAPLLPSVTFTHIFVIQPATVDKWVRRGLFMRSQLLFLGFLINIDLFAAFRAPFMMVRGISVSKHVRHGTFVELTLDSYLILGLKQQIIRIPSLEHLVDAAHQSISVVSCLLLTDSLRVGGITWLREGAHQNADTHWGFFSVIPHIYQVESHRRSRLDVRSIIKAYSTNRGETVLQGHDRLGGYILEADFGDYLRIVQLRIGVLLGSLKGRAQVRPIWLFTPSLHDLVI